MSYCREHDRNDCPCEGHREQTEAIVDAIEAAQKRTGVWLMSIYGVLVVIAMSVVFIAAVGS